ncbi:MAG: hypothetical protein CME62_14450 [Halobacteriovoraceae bacterium]|nr:hypothetical protein [Halobacteriovoraceae bacterium]
MSEVYFLIRYTPFWAVPVLMIAGEFTYKMWLRKKKKATLFCGILSIICLLSNIFYVYAGGPEKSVSLVKDMVWFYTR